VPLQLVHRNPCHHFSNVEERENKKRRYYFLSQHLSRLENEIIYGPAQKREEKI
jgi:hypothetical protein